MNEFNVGEIVKFKNDFGEELPCRVISKYHEGKDTFYTIESSYGIVRKKFKNGKGLVGYVH